MWKCLPELEELPTQESEAGKCVGYQSVVVRSINCIIILR